MEKAKFKILFLLIAGCLALMAEYAVGAALPGGSLDPCSVPKYQLPLIIPPAMPQAIQGKPNMDGNTKKEINSIIKQFRSKVNGGVDYYEIAVREFLQQILPPTYPTTKVWSYGSIHHPWTFNYPAFTIEANQNKTVVVKWINDLKDPLTGNFLPHLLPVDQTLHWANPPGGIAGRDTRGADPNLYLGPVPMVTHVHGAHTEEESDGYPEAWYLPAAAHRPVLCRSRLNL